MQIARAFTIHNRAAVFVLALLVFCPALRAQKMPAAEVWAGYSNLRFDSTTLGFSDHSYLNGWNIGASLPDLYEGLGVAVDVSGHYASRLEEYNFLIGPQYSFQWKSFRLYGHGLFGKARTRLREPGSTELEPSNLSRAIAFGGGLDVPLSGKISFRVIQGDYLRTSAFGGTQGNVRLSTGLIYRFGKH